MPETYQVIARRWRPKQFDEIVGQEHIVRTLKNSITQNRLPHAWLFVGPRGTGKTTTARILAKALNCEGGPSVSPPDNSPLCIAIMNGTCMDVQEIDGASNNSVDNIRQLREDCQYTPAQGKFKIYIIDEVHMLSTGAFNALLKTLEEPPPHVKFIFATTESQKVLPTIVSRCQRFEFRPISEKDIAEKLAQIINADGIKATPEALNSIARMAQGGMRDAQSILDQLIAYCGNKIAEKDVIEVYGLASAGELSALAKALVAGDYASIISQIDVLAAGGRDLFRVLGDIENVLRLALIEAVRGKGVAESLGPHARGDNLLRIVETLHGGEKAVRSGLDERVNFEVLLLRAAEQGRTRAIDALLHDLAEMSGGLPPEAAKKKITPAPGLAVETTSASATASTSVHASASASPAPAQAQVNSTTSATTAPLPDARTAYATLPESTRKILENELRATLRGIVTLSPDRLT